MSQKEYAFQSLISDIDDPRQQAKVAYPLDEILVLCLCGVICGCDSFVDIAEFGEEKLEFLRTLLPFEAGISSHDTLSAVFRQLEADAFNRAFITWAQGLQSRFAGSVIAIDGKTSRGSKDKGDSPLHMISAYCDDGRLVLGQRPCQHKKNEIKDIPALLELLSISGAIVTIDAMGCQKAIAGTIRQREADYVLALKGNQRELYWDVRLYFEESHMEKAESIQTVEGDKGRMETRQYTLCSDVGWLCERHPDWAGLTSIGKVEAIREIDGKVTTQTRYFISSLPANIQQFAKAVRGHWGIENRLHWVLDMVFGDDHCRVRKDNAAANFTTLKHVALNLIQKSRGKKSIRVMRKKAGWNNQILRKIITA